MKQVNYRKILVDAALNTIGEWEQFDYEINNEYEYITRRFYSEYSHDIARYGLHGAIKGWLQGLALDVPYMNFDIVELFVDSDAEHQELAKDEDEYYDVIESYWNELAHQVIEFIHNEV